MDGYYLIWCEGGDLKACWEGGKKAQETQRNLFPLASPAPGGRGERTGVSVALLLSSRPVSAGAADSVGARAGRLGRREVVEVRAVHSLPSEGSRGTVFIFTRRFIEAIGLGWSEGGLGPATQKRDRRTNGKLYVGEFLLPNI